MRYAPKSWYNFADINSEMTYGVLRAGFLKLQEDPQHTHRVNRGFYCLLYAALTNKGFALESSLTAYGLSKALHVGLISWLHQNKKLF